VLAEWGVPALQSLHEPYGQKKVRHGAPRALETLASPVDQGLHLRLGDLKCDRDVSVGEPFEVPKDDGCPVHRGQVGKNTADISCFEAL
jgi:hypothetical protein